MFYRGIKIASQCEILNGRYASIEFRLSLDHLSALTKKGETKMKLMNLFDRKGESSEASFGDTKLKETTNQLPSSPIQDENGNLTFTLEGKIYSLNVNSEEEREKVKEEVNTNSLTKYDWFKEETGEKHWVLYNTEMYEMIRDDVFYLHYKKDSNLAPVIPINASSCYKIFYDCTTSFNLSNFDTSKVTNMDCMFNRCESLTQLDLSNFDTSRVAEMYAMFWRCKALTKLNLSNFNTSSAIKMISMFRDCSALTQLDLSSFDVSHVTNMCYMFSGCSSLIQLDLSNFNTSSAHDIEFMFDGCSSLTAIDLSNFDTSKVYTLNWMFCDCEALTQLDLSSFDTSSVIRIEEMFAKCRKLTTIYISDKWNNTSVIFSDDMFEECCSIPGFSPEKIGIEMAKPIEQGGYLTLKR